MHDELSEKHYPGEIPPKSLLKLLLDMQNDTNDMKSLNVYIKREKRDFMGACYLFATSVQGLDQNFHDLVFTALQYFVCNGMTKRERELFDKCATDLISNGYGKDTLDFMKSF